MGFMTSAVRLPAGPTIGALGSEIAAQRDWDGEQARWDARQEEEARQAAARKQQFLSAPDADILDWTLHYSAAPRFSDIAQFIFEQAALGNATAQKFINQAAEVYAEHGDEL